MRRIYRTFLLAMLVAVVVVLQGATSARACPNCKEAVSLQTEDAASLSDGYNWSVMFMLVVPFSMMGTGAFVLHRAAKRGALPEM
jgi:heme/copper-type cytochrome/quinol oxidase subunit 2